MFINRSSPSIRSLIIREIIRNKINTVKSEAFISYHNFTTMSSEGKDHFFDSIL